MSSVSHPVKNHGLTRDIVGRNLYKSSNNDPLTDDGQTAMVFLDESIEKNYQERETVFDRLRFGKMSTWPITPSGHVEGTTVFPTRLIPASGSSLIDVAYDPENDDHDRERDGIRFQVYMDDETLLQSEINQCLLVN